MKSYPGRSSFLWIGGWFGLETRKADNGTGDILLLCQKNGLYRISYTMTTAPVTPTKSPFKFTWGNGSRNFEQNP